MLTLPRHDLGRRLRTMIPVRGGNDSKVARKTWGCHPEVFKIPLFQAGLLTIALHFLDDGPISSPDDIVRDPDWAEDRFRVDRKKLEALLSSDQAARIQQVRRRYYF